MPVRAACACSSIGCSRSGIVRLVKSAAASLMELQAWYGYPHQLETERLIMFYDDGVTDPQGEAAAMDQHVARMDFVPVLHH